MNGVYTNERPDGINNRPTPDRPTPDPSRDGGEVYDLSGRKMFNSQSSNVNSQFTIHNSQLSTANSQSSKNNSQLSTVNSQLKKGIYITRGKKVVIK